MLRTTASLDAAILPEAFAPIRDVARRAAAAIDRPPVHDATTWPTRSSCRTMSTSEDDDDDVCSRLCVHNALAVCKTLGSAEPECSRCNADCCTHVVQSWW